MRVLYNNPIPQPCKQDCPGRKAGCAIDCKAWADYLAKRGEYYSKHIKAGENRSPTTAARNRTREAILHTKTSRKKR